MTLRVHRTDPWHDRRDRHARGHPARPVGCGQVGPRAAPDRPRRDARRGRLYRASCHRRCPVRISSTDDRGADRGAGNRHRHPSLPRLRVPLALAIRLGCEERMPEPRRIDLAGASLREVTIDPHHATAALKVELALREATR
ncbi:hypothetical protein AB5I41_04945 [Sphingomonas sp. MMS24-JH45]